MELAAAAMADFAAEGIAGGWWGEVAGRLGSGWDVPTKDLVRIRMVDVAVRRLEAGGDAS